MVRYVGDDGRIGHAEISVGGARLMLADEYPEYGIVGPGRWAVRRSASASTSTMSTPSGPERSSTVRKDARPLTSRTASGSARSATLPDTAGRCRP